MGFSHRFAPMATIPRPAVTSRPPGSGIAPVAGGRRVARYTIREQLATGGMGVVYRVIHQSSGEERALKRMKPEAASQPLMVEAFEREYHVLASLNHPRIIRVFDYGVDELRPVLHDGAARG